VRSGQLIVSGSASSEAETFVATVHGAMLSARAYGTPETFGRIVSPLLERLTA
jgi:TetR/AcrR family transcriptional repressor of nem operon